MAFDKDGIFDGPSSYRRRRRGDPRRKSVPPRAMCLEEGCPVVVTGGGYCRRHRHLDQRKKSSTERGYGSRWKKVREEVLARDITCRCTDHECAWHRGRDCSALGTEVDHIHGFDLEGEGHYDLENLQALCRRCHGRKTALRDGGFGVGGRRPRKR